MNKKAIVFFILLLGAVFIVYKHSLNYKMIWDTKILVEKSDLLNKPLPWHSAFTQRWGESGVNRQFGYYRPVVILSFYIEKKLFGLSHKSITVANLLLFYFLLLMLFFFLKHNAANASLPYWVVMLFAFYPYNTDNIIWGVGRTDLFLLIFGILSLYSLSLYLKKNQIRFIYISSLCFAMGMLSKETFAFFLPVLIIYELIKRGKITIPYHLINAVQIIAFFYIKLKILEIKNLAFQNQPNPFLSIAKGIATLGYYMKNLIMPVSSDKFSFMENILNAKHIFIGVLALVCFLALILNWKKNSGLLLPLFLSAAFIIPAIVLVFLELDLNISTRYLMIPALGAIWFLILCSEKLRRPVQLLLVMTLLLLFIPSLILNSYPYRNEVKFWENVHDAFPQNRLIRLILAQNYWENSNNRLAETMINPVWRNKIEDEIDMLACQLLANIEFQKAMYDRVLALASAFGSGHTSLSIQLQSICAKVYADSGNISRAEAAWEKLAVIQPQVKDHYLNIYKMFVGYQRWDQAEAMANKIRDKFPEIQKPEPMVSKNSLAEIGLKEKIAFFCLHFNYIHASELVNHYYPPQIKKYLLLAELYYRQGKPGEAEKYIQIALKDTDSRGENYNIIGYFYLTRLFRSEQALIFFQKSLLQNPHQPNIANLIQSLKR